MDGVEESITTVESVGSVTSIATPGMDGSIGHDVWDADGYFTGLIDEVRIWNRSLTSDEAYYIYASNLRKSDASQWYLEVNQSQNATQTLAQGNYTYDLHATNASGNAGSAGTRSVEIDFNDKPIISELNLTSNDAGNRSSENLTVSASASDADGDDMKFLYDWVVNGSQLKLLDMPFERINESGSDNTRDYSYGRDATENGATWNQSGGYDGKGAYLFDGDDYINISGNDFPTGTSPRTLCAWAKSNDTEFDGNADHVVNYGTAANGEAFGFMILTGNNWYFYGHGGSFDIDTGIGVDTDWHHHCVSYDGSLVIYHYDGEAVSNASRTLSTNGGNMTFGLRPDRAATNYFDGYIDEVMLFNRTLSGAQDIPEETASKRPLVFLVAVLLGILLFLIVYDRKKERH